jgi:hypothetical protein
MPLFSFFVFAPRPPRGKAARCSRILEVEAFDHLAVRPAALEVRLPVEPIVERTPEVEILGDDLLEEGQSFSTLASHAARAIATFFAVVFSILCVAN